METVPMKEFDTYPTEEKFAAAYTLPDPLCREDGSRIADAAEWALSRRGEILEQFKKYEYGEIPPRPDRMRFQLLSRREDALSGMAVRKEIRIVCGMNNGRKISFDLLLYVPKNRKGRAPAFLGLNFKGNQNTTDEPDVRPTGFLAPDVLADPGRGVQKARWDFPAVVGRGYASATVCYHDIHPDAVNAAGRSMFRLFFEPEEYASIPEKYSVIGAWAWGLSRALDYLETDPDVDASRVAVHGHSRLGKTSLWAGAADTRFKMVVANCSGCGGGALHKRKIGENLSLHFQYHLNIGYPSWFVRELERFVWREEDLPIDQHELLALIAPRPLAIGTATRDLNADPKGEFLSCVHASDVYRLFGFPGLPVPEMPPPDAPAAGLISFHCRTGEHDQTPQDWKYYLDFADRWL